MIRADCRGTTGPAGLAPFLFVTLLALVLAGCGESPQRESIRLSGATMGTRYHITLVAPPDGSLEASEQALSRGIEAELSQLNEQLSTYIDDSELMRFNRAGVGQWQQLSRPLAEVLELSFEIGERSHGAFDITVAPLVNAWGFGPEGQPESVPDEAELAALKEATGYRKLEVDGRRARRLADIELDLSAVGKGYAVDHLARWLAQQGYSHYLVEIGGEVRLAGQSPRGDAWRIGVEQPAVLQQSGRMALALSDIAMATSGDYRNFYERDGRRYSHTIDPRTGRPVEHRLASVTVLAETAARADAWATALNVLGPEAGMALAEREKLPVYMIVKAEEGFEDRYSSAFESWRPNG